MHVYIYIYIHIYRERERQTDRLKGRETKRRDIGLQTARQTDRQTERPKDRETHKQTGRCCMGSQTDRPTDRQPDRQTDATSSCTELAKQDVQGLWGHQPPKRQGPSDDGKRRGARADRLRVELKSPTATVEGMWGGGGLSGCICACRGLGVERGEFLIWR